MQLSSTQRWHSSERIAIKVLEEHGYQIVETHRKIYINGVEVGEVDIIARDSEGNLYAVEVKAGKIDVTGIRQAYVNSVLLNMKPMVVCKGFADDAARELAQKLNVIVFQLSDIFLVESEELEVVIREAVEDAISNFFELLLSIPSDIKPEHIQVLEAISQSSSIQDTAERLNTSIDTVVRYLNEMRSIGIIPRWARKWSSIKRSAQIIVAKIKISETISTTKRTLEELGKILESIQHFYRNLKHSISLLDKISKELEDIAQQVEKLHQAIPLATRPGASS